MTDADKLAQVLAEHTICWNGAFGQWGCTGCDATYESHEYCYAEDEHAAHQAAVVLAHLKESGAMSVWRFTYPATGRTVERTTIIWERDVEEAP